jgi:predicted nucleotide-binding protein
VGALQDQLNAKANVTIWNQGVFALNASYVDSLIDGLKNSDFGVFVFFSDDIPIATVDWLRKGGRRGFQG